jgi:Flp pilus assembly protein TadD
LDPLSQIISANFAIIFLLTNDTSAAIEQTQKIIAFDPNHIIGHDWLGWAYFQAGRLADAITEREKAVGLSQRATPRLAGLGHVYAVAGRRKEALGLLKELEERYAKGDGVGQGPAAIYAGLGDFDRAFALVGEGLSTKKRGAAIHYLAGSVSVPPPRPALHRSGPAHGNQPLN